MANNDAVAMLKKHYDNLTKQVMSHVPKKLKDELALTEHLLGEAGVSAESETKRARQSDYVIDAGTLGYLKINPNHPDWQSKWKDTTELVFNYISNHRGCELSDISNDLSDVGSSVSDIVRWLEWTDRVQAIDPEQRKQAGLHHRKFEIINVTISVRTSPPAVEGEADLDEPTPKVTSTRKKPKGSGLKKGFKFPETIKREELLVDTVNDFPEGITTRDIYDLLKDDLDVGRKPMMLTLKSLREEGRIDWEKAPTHPRMMVTWKPSKKATRETRIRPGEAVEEGRLRA